MSTQKDPKTFPITTLPHLSQGLGEWQKALGLSHKASWQEVVEAFDDAFPKVPKHKRFPEVDAKLRMEVWKTNCSAQQLVDEKGVPIGKGILAVDMFNNVMFRDAMPGTLFAWDAEHIMPRARGGATNLTNLCLLNEKLNRVKSDSPYAFVLDGSYGMPRMLFLTLIKSHGSYAGLNIENFGINMGKILGWTATEDMIRQRLLEIHEKLLVFPGSADNKGSQTSKANLEKAESRSRKFHWILDELVTDNGIDYLKTAPLSDIWEALGKCENSNQLDDCHEKLYGRKQARESGIITIGKIKKMIAVLGEADIELSTRVVRNYGSPGWRNKGKASAASSSTTSLPTAPAQEDDDDTETSSVSEPEPLPNIRLTTRAREFVRWCATPDTIPDIALNKAKKWKDKLTNNQDIFARDDHSISQAKDRMAELRDALISAMNALPADKEVTLKQIATCTLNFAKKPKIKEIINHIHAELEANRTVAGSIII